MKKYLSYEEIGKEFVILYRNRLNKEMINQAIRGYFDRGQRASRLIKSLELIDSLEK